MEVAARLGTHVRRLFGAGMRVLGGMVPQAA
jgi:hypothetical protein